MCRKEKHGLSFNYLHTFTRCITLYCREDCLSGVQIFSVFSQTGFSVELSLNENVEWYSKLTKNANECYDCWVSQYLKFVVVELRDMSECAFWTSQLLFHCKRVILRVCHPHRLELNGKPVSTVMTGRHFEHSKLSKQFNTVNTVNTFNTFNTLNPIKMCFKGKHMK